MGELIATKVWQGTTNPIRLGFSEENKIRTKKKNIYSFHHGHVAEFVRALFCVPKGCRLDSWSEHIPRLHVPSMVWALMGRNQSMLVNINRFGKYGHFDDVNSSNP